MKWVVWTHAGVALRQKEQTGWRHTVEEELQRAPMIVFFKKRQVTHKNGMTTFCGMNVSPSREVRLSQPP